MLVYIVAPAVSVFVAVVVVQIILENHRDYQRNRPPLEKMVRVRDVQFRWPRFSWRVFLGVMCFLAAGLPRVVKGGSHDRWSLLFFAATYALGMVILVTGKRQSRPFPDPGRESGG